MNAEIKKRFPFYEKNKDVTYLDTAASSLKLDEVINSLNDYYINNGTNIHRGVYKLAHNATQAFEETRNVVANFIHAKPEEIIFTKGTTDALNKLAYSYQKNIQPGDQIITTELEHHSSLIPWQSIAKDKKAELKYIPLTKDGRITVENFKKVLTDKTKVVAITYVSNVLGYQTPIEEITRLAHEKGAIVILDAAQAVTHMEIDVKALDVDFMAFSAHKMYGPNGVGILYGKENRLNDLPPFEFGGEMAHLVYKDHSTWKDIPHKFEAGTPVIGEVIAFKEAIKFIESIGLKTIYEHEMSLRAYTVKKLSQIEGVTIYNKETESPIITFNIEDIHPHDVASVLDQKNVYIRAGHHCAQLVAQFLGVTSTLRASFGIYNTKEDCDRFIDAVKAAKEFFNGFW